MKKTIKDSVIIFKDELLEFVIKNKNIDRIIEERLNEYLHDTLEGYVKTYSFSYEDINLEFDFGDDFIRFELLIDVEVS